MTTGKHEDDEATGSMKLAMSRGAVPPDERKLKADDCENETRGGKNEVENAGREEEDTDEISDENDAPWTDSVAGSSDEDVIEEDADKHDEKEEGKQDEDEDDEDDE